MSDYNNDNYNNNNQYQKHIISEDEFAQTGNQKSFNQFSEKLIALNLKKKKKHKSRSPSSNQVIISDLNHYASKPSEQENDLSNLLTQLKTQNNRLKESMSPNINVNITNNRIKLNFGKHNKEEGNNLDISGSSNKSNNTISSYTSKNRSVSSNTLSQNKVISTSNNQYIKDVFSFRTDNLLPIKPITPKNKSKSKNTNKVSQGSMLSKNKESLIEDINNNVSEEIEKLRRENAEKERIIHEQEEQELALKNKEREERNRKRVEEKEKKKWLKEIEEKNRLIKEREEKQRLIKEIEEKNRIWHEREEAEKKQIELIERERYEKEEQWKKDEIWEKENKDRIAREWREKIEQEAKEKYENELKEKIEKELREKYETEQAERREQERKDKEEQWKIQQELLIPLEKEIEEKKKLEEFQEIERKRKEAEQQEEERRIAQEKNEIENKIKQEQLANERLRQEEMENERLRQEEMENERLRQEEMENERLRQEEIENERKIQEENENEKLIQPREEPEDINPIENVKDNEEKVEEEEDIFHSQNHNETNEINKNNMIFPEKKLNQTKQSLNMASEKEAPPLNKELDKKYCEFEIEEIGDISDNSRDKYFATKKEPLSPISNHSNRNTWISHKEEEIKTKDPNVENIITTFLKYDTKDKEEERINKSIEQVPSNVAKEIEKVKAQREKEKQEFLRKQKEENKEKENDSLDKKISQKEPKKKSHPPMPSLTQDDIIKILNQVKSNLSSNKISVDKSQYTQIVQIEQKENPYLSSPDETPNNLLLVRRRKAFNNQSYFTEYILKEHNIIEQLKKFPQNYQDILEECLKQYEQEKPFISLFNVVLGHDNNIKEEIKKVLSSEQPLKTCNLIGPIETMENFATYYSLNIKDSTTLKSLIQYFNYWRKIECDGNSFYRVFMFSLIENYIFTKNIHEIKKIILGIARLSDEEIMANDKKVDFSQILVIFFLFMNSFLKGITWRRMRFF